MYLHKIHVRNSFTYLFGHLLFVLLFHKTQSHVDHIEEPEKSDPSASASLMLSLCLAQEF